MLKGQTALVTGASRGIGKAVALELGRLGANVVGTATTAEGAEKISAYLSEAGVSGKGAMLEVRDQAQVDVLIDVVNETSADDFDQFDLLSSQLTDKRAELDDALDRLSRVLRG